MQKKKIVFLDEGRGIGGAERNLINILTYLNNEKFELSVILCKKDKLYSIIKNLKVKVFLMKMPKFLSTSLEIGNIRIYNPFNIIYDLFLVLFKSFKIFIFLKSHNDIQILQTNGMFEHIYGGIAAKLSKIKCIWHFQDIPVNFLFRFFLNILAFIFPEKIIVISKKVKAVFFKKIQKKIVLIYNGIDLNRFKLKDKDRYNRIKNNFGIKDYEFVIGITSRLVYWKGHIVFLKAASILSKKFSNLKFLIVGDTTFGNKKYLGRLKRLVEKLNIKDKVIFTGFIDNIEDILGIIDIFVHCSIRPEPFGLNIIEAMASEKLVIATDLGATDEIITNNKDGIIIKPNNPKILANTISEVIVSKEKYNRIGISARQKVEERFCIYNYIKNISELYNSLV